ncbi:hypothetical protein PoB_001194600 [Plakobranchus ocellatus]|uniref:Uncharacterized protein n=1 Tax=Plakobranchus ocellatus TaxID=259542 RepID=A0AAV3YQ60_9GAST|nr:hypothetical protein PoB_001194600 [Plakobranchus ocellatus]
MMLKHCFSVTVSFFNSVKSPKVTLGIALLALKDVENACSEHIRNPPQLMRYCTFLQSEKSLHITIQAIGCMPLPGMLRAASGPLHSPSFRFLLLASCLLTHTDGLMRLLHKHAEFVQTIHIKHEGSSHITKRSTNENPDLLHVAFAAQNQSIKLRLKRHDNSLPLPVYTLNSGQAVKRPIRETPTLRGFVGTAVNVSDLGSAGSFRSRVGSSPPNLRPDGVLMALSSSTALSISSHQIICSHGLEGEDLRMRLRGSTLSFHLDMMELIQEAIWPNGVRTNQHFHEQTHTHVHTQKLRGPLDLNSPPTTEHLCEQVMAWPLVAKKFCPGATPSLIT